MRKGRPWDSGLQIERTRLAWQRTALSSLAFTILIARLVGAYSIAAGVTLAAAAVAMGVGVAVTSARRYHRGNTALAATHPLPDGRAFVALAALITVAGLGALLLAIIQPTLG